MSARRSVRRSKTPVSSSLASGQGQPTHRQALARSIVHRRLPRALRERLDSAILLRPAEMRTLDAISSHFHLVEYGISPASLRIYAGRLEELVRPAATGELVAAAMGLLPANQRHRLLAGTRMLFVSKVAQALSSEGTALSVAELARLGSVLAGLERPRRHCRNTSCARSAASQASAEPARIAELVRNVYGVQLSESSQPPSGLESSRTRP